MSSVLPDWMSTLPMQQQSVLLLALRGPDGQVKNTYFKQLLRCYRATVLKAAKYGQELGDKQGDSFMNLDIMKTLDWKLTINGFIDNESDAEILHHYTHFMHGVEILGYKHPDEKMRSLWNGLYLIMVDKLHLNPETQQQMDERLSDWGRKHWEI